MQTTPPSAIVVKNMAPHLAVTTTASLRNVTNEEHAASTSRMRLHQHPQPSSNIQAVQSVNVLLPPEMTHG